MKSILLPDKLHTIMFLFTKTNKMKKLMIAIALAFVSMAGMAQNFRANIDESVKPGDDFWHYAVGNWLKNNPLDKEHPKNGAFTDLDELNKKRINELIMKYANEKNLPQGSDGQKIGTLYRLYMDSVGRNKLGYEPIMPYLKQVRAIKTREEALKVMTELDVKGFDTAPYGISLGINTFNSSEYIVEVEHYGASLPQEYYGEPNEQQKLVVDVIKSLNKDFLKMVGNSEADAERKMQAAWGIEHRIGVKQLNQVEERDPQKTTHIMPWEQLLQDFKGIDWVAYRDAMGYPKDIDEVDVYQLEPLHEVEKLLAEASVEELKAFMEIKVIRAYGAYLHDAFTDRMFEANKAISGVQEQEPRWKRAVSVINNNLGENIGDNGGIQMAYRAFENRMKQEPLNTIDGFTPAQRFYLAYARVWASNVTPEYTALLVNSDVHSPNNFRVNAALPMIDSWYDAFNIQPTDKMFIPKEKRALVW